jgi:hypothetical protein
MSRVLDTSIMEAPPPVPQTLPEEPQAPPTSLTGRLFNVFATPGEVFDEVKRAPVVSANWLVPAILFILVGWIGVTVIFSQPALKQQLVEMVEKPVRQQLERSSIPKEKLEDTIQTTMKILQIWTTIASYAGPIGMAFLSLFGWGLVIWLCGTKAFKSSSFEYMKAVELVGLANMIVVLEAVIRPLLALSTNNFFASASLALLVKDFNPQNPVHSLMALANIMTIWVLAVRSIGLARLANVSVAKASACIFGIWFAFNGLLVGFGALGQMFVKHPPGS